jgi:phospholipase C
MSTPSQENALDLVVVVRFENRSFDNLLGRLYVPGEVASFEGVIGKDLSDPVPEWAEHRSEDRIVPYHVAANMNTPDPDPGEELPHINTQLSGIIDEESIGKLEDPTAVGSAGCGAEAKQSFNEPRGPGADDGRLRQRVDRGLRRAGPVADRAGGPASFGGLP